MAAGLLIALAAAAAGWPSLEGDFVYDDQYYLLENPAVAGPTSPWTSPLGTEAQALWRPLTVATWALQWNGPQDPGPLHAGNLALHVLVSLLVALWARALGAGDVAATIAGLLFAVHPVHAEAVAWISGRAELLAAACVLLAWIAHLGRRWPSAVVACLFVTLGTLAKENAFIAPVLFVAGDVLLRRRPVPRGRWLALGGLVALIWLLRAAVLPAALPSEAPFGQTPLATRLPLALVLAGRAWLELLGTGTVRVLHPREEFLGHQANWAGPLVALTVLGLALLLLARRQRLAASAAALASLALLPTLNLLPIGATFAARFLYLPSAPFCLAAGLLATAWMRHELRRERLGLSLLVAAAVFLTALIAMRADVRVFRTDLELWAHESAVAPQSAVARYNHGYFLDRAGLWNARDDARPGAAEELRASLQIDPQHAYAGLAHQLLGHLALVGAGHRPPDALLAAQHYREALERMPGLADARINLASLALAAPHVVSLQEGWDSLQPLAETALDAERAAAWSRLQSELLAALALGSGAAADEPR